MTTQSLFIETSWLVFFLLVTTSSSVLVQVTDLIELQPGRLGTYSQSLHANTSWEIIQNFDSKSCDGNSCHTNFTITKWNRKKDLEIRLTVPEGKELLIRKHANASHVKYPIVFYFMADIQSQKSVCNSFASQQFTVDDIDFKLRGRHTGNLRFSLPASARLSCYQFDFNLPLLDDSLSDSEYRLTELSWTIRRRRALQIDSPITYVVSDSSSAWDLWHQSDNSIGGSMQVVDIVDLPPTTVPTMVPTALTLKPTPTPSTLTPRVSTSTPGAGATGGPTASAVTPTTTVGNSPPPTTAAGATETTSHALALGYYATTLWGTVILLLVLGDCIS